MADAHSLDRRKFLAGAAALPAVAVLAGNAQAAPAGRSAEDKLRDADKALLDSLGNAPPMNLARAHEILERHDLEGLVLGHPRNVFHASGSWPFLGRTRPFFPPTTLAIISRDPKQAPALVTSKFLYYYTFGDAVSAPQRQVFLYVDQPEKPGDFYPDSHEVPLSDVEVHRMDVVNSALGTHPVSVGLAATVVEAMKSMGLWKGRIGVDHPAIAQMCAHADHPGQTVDADIPLAEIRIIKSPLEIALMRRASAANIDAVHAAAAQIRAGATYRDLRTYFYTEGTKRGNLPQSMTVDRISTELADASLRDGQALMIDAVSTFQGYCGDYGRTIFLGEPAAPMKKAIAASAVCWDEMVKVLKPGARYSDIAAAGRTALRKSGYSTRVSIGHHSLGLMHHDEPAPYVNGVLTPADLVLAENMTLSIECVASADTGVGGSAHYEDVILITKDGPVTLHRKTEPVIQV